MRLLFGKFVWKMYILKILFVILLALTTLFFITPLPTNVSKKEEFIHSSLEDENLMTANAGCIIPNVTVQDTDLPLTAVQNIKNLSCTKPFLASGLSTMFLKTRFLDSSNYECCYYAGDKRLDDIDCIGINLSEPTVVNDEFITVKCYTRGRKVYQDYFTFVPLEKHSASTVEKKLPDILIILLKDISKNELQKYMPKTLQFFKDKSSNAIEFLAFQPSDETAQKLLFYSNNQHPDYQFVHSNAIWKDFQTKGYKVALADNMKDEIPFDIEDAPPDYNPKRYWRTRIWSGINPETLCIGSKEPDGVLFEYILKFTKTMKKHDVPFFGFFHEMYLSTNREKLLSNSDKKFRLLLDKLYNSGALKNTFVFFLSEVELKDEYPLKNPFFWLLVPDSFKESERISFINMQINSRAMITVHDITVTLKDLLQLYTDFKPEFQDFFTLLTPITNLRSCDLSQIPTSSCTCFPVSYHPSNELLFEVTQYVLNYLNYELKKYPESSQKCPPFETFEVLYGFVHTTPVSKLINGKRYVTVVFNTNFNVPYWAIVKESGTDNDKSLSVVDNVQLYEPKQGHIASSCLTLNKGLDDLCHC